MDGICGGGVLICLWEGGFEPAPLIRIRGRIGEAVLEVVRVADTPQTSGPGGDWVAGSFLSLRGMIFSLGVLVPPAISAKGGGMPSTEEEEDIEAENPPPGDL